MSDQSPPSEHDQLVWLTQEVDRLAAERDRLAEALRPFVYAGRFPTSAEYRAAIAALAGLPGGEQSDE
jgi:hypothetical protein